jgi:hypothetical protein
VLRGGFEEEAVSNLPTADEPVGEDARPDVSPAMQVGA